MRGQKLLQVSGILLIVFYSIGILLGCVSIFWLIGIQASLNNYTLGISSSVFNFGLMWLGLVLMFSAIVSIFGLTTGILGTAYCKQKSKAKICMAMGIVLIILIFIERILNIFYAFSLTESLSNIARYAGYADDLDTYAGISIVSGFIGLFVALVTPILYTIGASLFSKNNGNMHGSFNNTNQYPPYNNANNQYPPYNNGNNQIPNNQNNASGSNFRSNF